MGTPDGNGGEWEGRAIGEEAAAKPLFPGRMAANRGIGATPDRHPTIGLARLSNGQRGTQMIPPTSPKANR